MSRLIHHTPQARRVVTGAVILLALIAGTTFAVAPWDAPKQAIQPLEPPETFAGLEDESARSIALFLEAGKVLTHPRCINCHPSGDRPLQGELSEPHQPPVLRGPDNHGVVGMRCQTCHFAENFDPGGVPGDAHWSLAPRSMGWEGLTLGEICQQLKDQERNGGFDLEAIVTHVSEDPLVAWGWNPGAGREPAPGDQKTFGALIRAWVDTGAACPGD